MQHEEADDDQQHRPESPQLLKDGNAEVIEQEQNAEPDEQRGADGRVHLHIAQAEPLRNRMPELPGPRGLVGVNHHVEVKRRGTQAENGVERSAHPVTHGDERSKQQNLNHSLDDLSVVNGPDAGDEAQGERDTGTRSLAHDGWKTAQTRGQAILAVDRAVHIVLARGAQGAPALSTEGNGIGFRMMNAFHRVGLLLVSGPAGGGKAAKATRNARSSSGRADSAICGRPGGLPSVVLPGAGSGWGDPFCGAPSAGCFPGESASAAIRFHKPPGGRNRTSRPARQASARSDLPGKPSCVGSGPRESDRAS